MTLVHEALGIRKLTDGDLGVEIEVEGDNLPGAPLKWRREDDGSLRGESAEYVLNEPLSLSGALEAIDDLSRRFEQADSVIRDSVRAGVHVHVNVQHLTDIELATFITCYLIIEDLLVKFCGEDREGNLFCLRLKDAELPMFRVIEGFKTGAIHGNFFMDDDLRYSAMNLKALATYGSLEFRSMRTGSNFSKIKDWATILYDLRERSRQFANPKEVIEAFSGDMVDGFVRRIIGNHSNKLLCEGYEDMLVDGMRRAQDIAYCVDWHNWELRKPNIFNQGGEEVAEEVEEVPRVKWAIEKARMPIQHEPMEDV